MPQTPRDKKKRETPIKRWLISQCETMRRHVEVRRLATPAQLADEWPTVALKRASVHELVRLYGTLRAWVYQQDLMPTGRDQAEETMLEALNEEPRAVVLPVASRKETVYPKSLHTLLWFRQRDWMVGWLAARSHAIRQAADDGEITPEILAKPLTALAGIEEELAHQLKQMAACACFKGVGLPPEANDSEWAPEEWQDLDSLDLYSIHSAFLEVNAGRMEALNRIVKPSKKANDTDDRMSWNVFLGTLAVKLQKDPTELARAHSLVKILSMVRLHRSSEEEAQA